MTFTGRFVLLVIRPGFSFFWAQDLCSTVGHSLPPGLLFRVAERASKRRGPGPCGPLLKSKPSEVLAAGRALSFTAYELMKVFA
jgi:hypothetical protein